MTTELIQIAPSLIAPSLTNPRKTFNAERLAELAESIKTSGVHSPLLLRPLPAGRLQDTFTNRAAGAELPTHELVTGERRLRASIMAEQATVPALVRDLTDDEVLEIQIIENLQRDDLSELEEAEGYEMLMQHGHNGERLTVDQVGAKIGKSRSYVYARLKLLDLCQEGREAMRSGALDASRGLKVARVPTHKLQLRAIEALTHKDGQGETLSARQADLWLRTNLMLKLETAPFDTKDAKLVAQAGACQVCPKRTGANPELFEDVGSADVCTDTTCYHDKVQAHTDRIVERARKKGIEVIDGEEAAKVKPYPGTAWMRGYENADDKVSGEGVSTSLRELATPHELKKIKLLIDPHTHQAIEVFPDDLAYEMRTRAETARQKAKGKKTPADQSAKDIERELAKQREALTDEYHTTWRKQAVELLEPRVIAGEVNQFTPDMLRAVIFYMNRGFEDPPQGRILEQVIGVEAVEWYEPRQVTAVLAKTDNLVLGASLIRWLLRHELDANWVWNNSVKEYIDDAPMIEAVASMLDVDLQAIKAGVKDLMREEFAALEKPSDPLPSAAQAVDKREAKAKKSKPAGAAAKKPKTTPEEALQGIAAAMQGEGGNAADDGREDQGDSEDAASTRHPHLAWPFPKLTPEGAST
jgi:ParB/RepB/Spo0J family partition protein